LLKQGLIWWFRNIFRFFVTYREGSSYLKTILNKQVANRFKGDRIWLFLGENFSDIEYQENRSKWWKKTKKYHKNFVDKILNVCCSRSTRLKLAVGISVFMERSFHKRFWRLLHFLCRLFQKSSE